MSLSTLKVNFNLDSVICNSESEGGRSQPYLWTVFFSVDGPNITIDSTNHLVGIPFFQDQTGDQGNLDVDHVTADNEIPVPPAVGKLLIPRIMEPLKHDQNSSTFAGFIGCIATLLDQDSSLGRDIQEVHEVYNNVVREEFINLFPKLHPPNFQPSPNQINDTAKKITKKVDMALKERRRPDRDSDDRIGTTMFTFSQTQLAATPVISFKSRISQGEDDWEVSGKVSAQVLA